MKFNPNPMKAKGEPVNASKGEHTSGKTGRHKNPKMGAGKDLGPSVGKGYPLTGKSDSNKTGGKFASADTAKSTSKTKKKG